MNKVYRLISFFLVFLLFGGCVDQIEFPLNLGDERLVVAGQLNNWDETQYVFLSETTSADREPILTDGYFTINDLPRPVRGAQVSVQSSNGQSWDYVETEPGTYALDDFPGPESGVEYYVQILANGRVYQSTPEVMPEAIGRDEISYTFDRGEFNNQPEIPFISINSEVTLPEQQGDYFLRWDVEEVFYWNLTFFPNPFNKPPPDCYVFGFADPERITLLNGDLLNRPGGTSVQTLAERQVDQSFLSRHYFNVRQVSTTRESYEYRRKIRELVNNSGSVFDAPPAPIQGNLRNVNNDGETVLGYFEVAKVDITRIYTTKADVPFFIEEICEYDPNRPFSDYPRTCLSCSEWDNSTGITPEWWFDQ